MDEYGVKEQNKVVWIVWFALIAALGTYLLVIWLLAEGGEAPVQENIDNATTLLPILAALGAAQLLALFVVRPIFFFRRYREREFDTPRELSGAYFTMSIVTWAMVEAVAIYGFVLSILTYDMIYYMGFAIPALVFMIVFRPNLVRLVEEYQWP